MPLKMLLGIGNPLRGDDGVGPMVADSFRHPEWMAVNCGTVPENFTSVVRKMHPEVLVLVDAAEMSIAPGELRRIQKEQVEQVAFSTHHMPLSLLMEFLADTAGTIVFVGVQPKIVEDAEGLSPEVEAGAIRLMEILDKGSFQDIPAL